MEVRVSVLGAGNGGCATVRPTSVCAGSALTLFDLPAFASVLAPIRAAGASGSPACSAT